MVFSIDAAVESLRALDGLPEKYGVSAFQRNNHLHLVGRSAVAVLDYGIPCSPFESHWDDLGYISEPSRMKSNVINNSGRILKSERRHFKPLILDSDGDNPTLDDVLKAGEIIYRKLPNDGKIRMISHSADHHSHKHGYASDGVDVSVADARVMVRQEYFDLMRMEELKRRANFDEKPFLPGVVLITKHGLASFPFPISLRQDDFKRDWRNNSPVIVDRMIEFEKSPPLKTDKSPYSFNVMLFSERQEFPSLEAFSKGYGDTLEELARLKDCYTPSVKAIIDEVNSLHNLKYVERAEERKPSAEKPCLRVA